MARVGKIKYLFQNQHLETPVNCNSSGEFSCILPAEVSNVLHLQKELRGKTMQDVTSAFFNALKRYKEAETKQELLIFIQYRACGHYRCKSDGDSVLFGNSSDYYMNVSFSDVDALGFDFDVVIRETVDGVETIYYAVKGKDIFHDDHSDEPEKYFKHGEFYSGNKNGKFIPYTEDAHHSLLLVQEKIRAASEILFKFIDQPEDLIIKQLNSGFKALM